MDNYVKTSTTPKEEEDSTSVHADREPNRTLHSPAPTSNQHRDTLPPTSPFSFSSTNESLLHHNDHNVTQGHYFDYTGMIPKPSYYYEKKEDPYFGQRTLPKPLPAPVKIHIQNKDHKHLEDTKKRELHLTRI